MPSLAHSHSDGVDLPIVLTRVSEFDIIDALQDSSFTLTVTPDSIPFLRLCRGEKLMVSVALDAISFRPYLSSRDHRAVRTHLLGWSADTYRIMLTDQHLIVKPDDLKQGKHGLRQSH
ncbi:MAG: hypothetical protein U5L72_02300 [Bacteroidales bacterium]|nr:hypothetical protein [Bacteroidales bacterium]